MSPKVSRATTIAAVIALGAALAACGTSAPVAAPRSASAAPGPMPSGSWPYPNGDLANTRVAPDSTISSANVSQLRQAWAFTLPGKGTAGVGGLDIGPIGMQPVVSHGVVYVQDLAANVFAVSLSTGKPLWEYQAGVPESSRTDPHGVAVADGEVYGDSSATVFALNATTGKPAWVDKGLLPAGQRLFDTQPQVVGGRVFLASQYAIGRGGGVLLALDASTGRLIWKAPVGQHNGHDNDSLQALEHHSTLKAPYTILPGPIGGVLFNPAVAGHSVYVATTDVRFTATSLDQPAGSPSGNASGEVEALDLATGKAEWDTKVPAPPLGAATVSSDLLFTTLASPGTLIALDRNTGKIVYRNPLPATRYHKSADRHRRQHRTRGRRCRGRPAATGGLHRTVTKRRRRTPAPRTATSRSGGPHEPFPVTAPGPASWGTSSRGRNARSRPATTVVAITPSPGSGAPRHRPRSISRRSSIRTGGDKRLNLVAGLPAPFGPSRANTPPLGTDRSSPSTARISPNALTSPHASIANGTPDVVVMRSMLSARRQRCRRATEATSA